MLYQDNIPVVDNFLILITCLLDSVLNCKENILVTPGRQSVKILWTFYGTLALYFFTKVFCFYLKKACPFNGVRFKIRN